MEEASSLFPPDALSDVLRRLQELRLKRSFGYVKIRVAHGYISGIGDYEDEKYPFKDKDKESSRTCSPPDIL